MFFSLHTISFSSLSDFKQAPRLIVNTSISVIAQKGQPLTAKFRFRHKNGDYVTLRASCYSFQNPYTDEAEYIICTNSPVRNRLEKIPTSTKQEADSPQSEEMQKSPQYNDVTAKFQEMPGSFPYPQVLESPRYGQATTSAISPEDESDRGKAGKRKSPGQKSKKGAAKGGKMDYPGGYDRLPTDDKYMPQIPFGDFSSSQAGDMLRALAKRQQEQSQIALRKSAQFDPAMYSASHVNWPGSGDLNLPGSESSYDYVDSGPPGPSVRSQSSPYNLPSEIVIARRMMQQSANRGFEQPMGGAVPYGQQPITPSMPSPNSQQLASPSTAQQKMLSFQQQLGQPRQTDMQFPYYNN